jgi:hypothetical protein
MLEFIILIVIRQFVALVLVVMFQRIAGRRVQFVLVEFVVVQFVGNPALDLVRDRRGDWRSGDKR